MNPWLLAMLALALLAPAVAATPLVGPPLPLQDRDCQLDCWAVRTVLGIAGEVPEPPLTPPGGADPQQPAGPGGLAE